MPDGWFLLLHIGIASLTFALISIGAPSILEGCVSI
jgi:hypothetical protein